MESIIEFPDRDVIEDEAWVWLIRLDGDKPLSDSEERTFDEWLARSPAHREMLKTLNTFWAKSNVLSELMEPESIMTLCRKRLLGFFWPRSGFKRGFRGTFKGAFRVVAVTSVLMAFTFVFMMNEQGITASNGLYVTAVGQQKVITLADDSQLQLNTNSQIQVDYNKGYRNIRLLQGEVHFDVAKDASKPFRVYAGSGRVQAVGTAFNVYLNNNEVDVFVTEGRVSLASTLPPVLSDSESRLHIAANDKSLNETADLYAETQLNGLGVFSAGQGVTLKETQEKSAGQSQGAIQRHSIVELLSEVKDDVKTQQSRLAWRQGLLIFSGETLEEAMTEVGRYTTVTIEIVDPALRQLKIGGQIQVSDTDSMFKALEANFGLTVKRLSYNRVQVVAKDSSIKNKKSGQL